MKIYHNISTYFIAIFLVISAFSCDVERFEPDLYHDGLTQYSETGTNQASALLNDRIALRNVSYQGLLLPILLNQHRYIPNLSLGDAQLSMPALAFTLRKPSSLEENRLEYRIYLPLSDQLMEELQDVSSLNGLSIDLGQMPAYVQEGSEFYASTRGNLTIRHVSIIENMNRFIVSGTFGFELSGTPSEATSFTSGRFDFEFEFERPYFFFRGMRG
ncbi:MAG: hypothetical protein LAT68_10540 [Cyclobacteriaceae bacterium]|nr:hypothetical protein [Cyclobacteriaceae bacterium]MCH8516753.1 hypothetical protein [Cyclobacteriaceae bacterium]